MATRKIPRKDEQLLKKLNSILALYKSFQHDADERDKLIIIQALDDLRKILTGTYISKPMKANDASEIELILKDLNCHVKAMALDELFDEVNDMKLRLDVVEKRFELEDTRRHPKIYFRDEDEDEIWSRISAMRKETLGQSSLVLRSDFPPNMRKVRFDLPDSTFREEAGSDEENARAESGPETSGWVPNNLHSTEQLLRNRVGDHGFLSERRTRFRPAKRRNMSANYTAVLENEKILKSVGRAPVRHGNTAATTTTMASCDGEDNKQKKSNNETYLRCGECQRILKERDKFWGLESDSEEEEIKDFNEHVRRRSLQRDSRSFQTLKEKTADNGRSCKGKRIAGRGTWVTPAYVPPWEMRRASSNRDSIMREEGWFGQKKGI
ncbi:hypothetical protein AWC38_SpisGene4031 [Stylophora pistillata]|uniref:Uncharacterized protein n=2 Tax=Stylophora pistillata TaxID=50429 RepID=A0A2B4SQH3_STYPI|nr:hypothetical protein AWC38_SpisGene4031 [Stylophora pistillata]